VERFPQGKAENGRPAAITVSGWYRLRGWRQAVDDMRLKKAELEMIRLARVCRVATADRGGTAHCVPVCPVFDGKTICFGSANGGRKISHLRRNPNAALLFDDYSEAWSGLRGVVVSGTARMYERGVRFRKIRRVLYRKYPQYEEEAALDEGDSVIVEVTPRRSFSWGF
jgi:nitroimidazol reductase NimA-like FMN-containing flavoprotein (pyridoxamine 5'-phosphate oxidase superfamily)